MTTYTVILNWNDNDSEEGTFGTTVRADNPDEAEAKARAEMRSCYIEEYGEDGDANREFDGSVVELSEGAYWLSSRMEKVLRAAIAAADANTSFDLSEARAIIAEIDAK